MLQEDVFDQFFYYDIASGLVVAALVAFSSSFPLASNINIILIIHTTQIPFRDLLDELAWLK